METLVRAFGDLPIFDLQVRQVEVAGVEDAIPSEGHADRRFSCALPPPFNRAGIITAIPVIEVPVVALLTGLDDAIPADCTALVGCAIAVVVLAVACRFNRLEVGSVFGRSTVGEEASGSTGLYGTTAYTHL